MSKPLKYVLIFFISMLPIIELRGAIPVATGWGLDLVTSYIIAIIGNMIPVPFIYLFARTILEWGKDKPLIGGFCSWLIRKGEHAGRKMQGKTGVALFVALMLFVGIPLPGTGAWTGTFAASILHIEFKKTVIAVTCGVLIAGVIMLLVSLGVLTGLDFLLG